MRIKLTKNDVIWSYVGTAFSMGSNLIMLPFLIYYLDSDMLGMWYVFVSLGAIASLFDFGFSVTFARNITYCWNGAKELKKENVVFVNASEPDYYLMKQVLLTCKVLYAFLAGFALILLLTIGTTYITFLGRNLLGNTHIIAWVVYSFAIFLNLYYGYYASFLRGVGAVNRVNKNTIIARIVQIIFTVILLFLGMGIIGASIAYLSYGTLFRLLGKKHFYDYSGIGECLRKISSKVNYIQIKTLFIIVWHNAWRDGVISLTTYLCNQASTIICSIYLPLSETGVYSIGVQIAMAIAQISGTLYNAYQPELQSAYISNELEKQRKILSMIVMTFIYLFILGTILFCVFGVPILKIIRPSTVVSIPVLIGLCSYQFMLKFRNCYTSYFSCTNRIIYLRGFVVSAFLCVAFSFVALGVFDEGIWGLIVAQLASQAVYNIWKWPICAHAELELPVKEMVAIGTKESLDQIRNMLRRGKLEN